MLFVLTGAPSAGVAQNVAGVLFKPSGADFTLALPAANGARYELGALIAQGRPGVLASMVAQRGTPDPSLFPAAVTVFSGAALSTLVRLRPAEALFSGSLHVGVQVPVRWDLSWYVQGGANLTVSPRATGEVRGAARFGVNYRLPPPRALDVIAMN